MYFVGQWRSHSIMEGTVWDYQGVFSTYEKALAACKTDKYFIAPVQLDMEIPEEPTTWEVEYPIAASSGNPEE